jgi:photosystem II stability/assembly factor-like uncharacterized protein
MKMIKYISTFLKVFFFYQHLLFAQNCVEFVSSKVGWTINYGGVILRTLNGGLTWMPQKSGTENSLWDAAFINENNGLVVGDNGVILRTTDGGLNWNTEISGVTNCLYAVTFIDDNKAVAVGDNGIIIKTTDSGITWKQQINQDHNFLWGVSFSSENVGIAVGTNGTILRTTTGGYKWDLQPIETSLQLYDVTFLDQNIFVAVGELGTFLRSTDNGITWISHSIYPASNMFSVSFVDENNGIAVGYRAVVFVTSDGGINWYSTFGGMNVYDLYDVDFIDENNAVTVGDYGIIYSSNKGISWDTQSSRSKNFLTSVYSVGENSVTVGYSGIILRNLLDENVWVPHLSRTSNMIEGVSFADENNGLAVGWNGTALKTTDGGISWSEQYNGTSENLLAVDFQKTNSKATVVGSNGMILLTTDSGKNWIAQLLETNNNLWGVSYSSEFNGVIVGENGIILETTNGGSTWNPKSSGTINDLLDIFFSDENNGVIVGKNGTVFRTTDGGDNWNSIESGTDNDLWGVHCFNNNCIAVGSDGTILKSTDIGINWVKELSETSYDLFDIFFQNADNGIVVGANGTILRTSNGGITFNQDTILFDYQHSYDLFPLGIGNEYTYSYQFSDSTYWVGIFESTQDDSGTISYKIIDSTLIMNKIEWLVERSVNLLRHLVYPDNEIDTTYLVQILDDFVLTESLNGNHELTASPPIINYGSSDIWAFPALGQTSIYRYHSTPSDVIYKFNNDLLFDSLWFNETKGLFSRKYYNVFSSNHNIYYKTKIDLVDIYLKIKDRIISPKDFSLAQNYPNPFNPRTTIEYSIPTQSKVTIKVFDLLGREVATLVDEEKTAGSYMIDFNGSNLSSGIYFYRLDAGGFSETKKLILIK